MKLLLAGLAAVAVARLLHLFPSIVALAAVVCMVALKVLCDKTLPQRPRAEPKRPEKALLHDRYEYGKVCVSLI